MHQHLVLLLRSLFVNRAIGLVSFFFFLFFFAGNQYADVQTEYWLEIRVNNVRRKGIAFEIVLCKPRNRSCIFSNSKPVYTASSQTVLGFPAFRGACFVSKFMSVYRMASILTLNISHCGELCDSSISDDQIIKKNVSIWYLKVMLIKLYRPCIIGWLQTAKTS